MTSCNGNNEYVSSGSGADVMDIIVDTDNIDGEADNWKITPRNVNAEEQAV